MCKLNRRKIVFFLWFSLYFKYEPTMKLWIKLFNFRCVFCLFYSEPFFLCGFYDTYKMIARQLWHGLFTNFPKCLSLISSAFSPNIALYCVRLIHSPLLPLAQCYAVYLRLSFNFNRQRKRKIRWIRSCVSYYRIWTQSYIYKYKLRAFLSLLSFTSAAQ